MAGARQIVRFEAVSKRFSGVPALEKLSLDIIRGEFFALLGPSGCGKTTLLRLLAGFEVPDDGRILLDGADVAAVPPYRRTANMMFQNYALFPHLTVENNVAFGLRQERLARAEINARVREALALFKIENLAGRKPDQLSGGQRQRVALARALVKRPKVFLLDEPLAALDKKLRAQMQFELKELQRSLGLTFVIVTHDQEEAMSMADRIGVMDKGRVVQIGSPAEIYEKPNSRWVAEFIGDVNLFEGKVTDLAGGGALVETAALGCVRVASNAGAKVGERIFVAIRPEKLHVDRNPTPAVENSVGGTVSDIGYLGDMSIYKIRLRSGAVVKAAVANSTRAPEQPIGVGEEVSLLFPPHACMALTR